MMVECMLQSKKKWDRVVKFITAVMTRKEVDERAVTAQQQQQQQQQQLYIS